MQAVTQRRILGAALALNLTLVGSGIGALKDYGLKDYVYMSRDLPHAQTNDWRLVCQLPYNAQFTAWIQVTSDSTGQVVDVRSSNPLSNPRKDKTLAFTTTGGDQTYEMPEWQSGEGVIYSIPARVKVVAVKYRETGFDTTFAGSFSCNDNDYNVLWQKATRTCYICIRDHYMDCPDRERSEWLGDAVLEMEECFYVFDVASHQMAKRLILSKQINAMAGQNLIAHGEYGDWCYYLYTGDLETLAAVYANTRKYLEQYTLGTNGLPPHLKSGLEWYDWGTGYQDVTVIQVAEIYSALSALKKMAQATGHTEDIPAIELKLDSIRQNFDRVFWHPDGYRSGDYLDERANAMAVCAGLVDESKWERISRLIGTEGNCGPYFERWVLEALCRMGRQEQALLRMANRYRAQINARFTTLWEYMEREFERGGATDRGGYVTLNHAWNTPNTILSRYIAGVAPDSPGWATYHVLPKEAFLTSLNVTVPTVKGAVAVVINKTDTTYGLTVTSPSNTTAIVGIPKGSFSKLESIAANGSVLWKGAAAGRLEGVEFAGEDSNYVTFRVKPGTWAFVGTGVVPLATPKAPAVASDTDVKLSKKSWTAGAWDTDRTDAVDGDSWTGGNAPGGWLIIDMKQPERFDKIVLDNVWAIYEGPAQYAIYASDDLAKWDDKAKWGAPLATGAGDRGGMTTATFPETTARYVKLEGPGWKGRDWSVFEVDLYRTRQVAPPNFAPAGGFYTNAQTVTIRTATDGATIRYTTDGSTPSATRGTVYSAPVSIGAKTTLKAIACRAGLSDSYGSATYTILPTPPKEIFVESPGQSKPAEPYDTWATAADDIQTAVDYAGALAPNSPTVSVAKGRYPITRQITIDKPIHLRSAEGGLSGASNAVVERVDPACTRLFLLTHADASIEGLTIRGGSNGGLGANYSGNGLGVNMTGGLVRDCIIRDNGPSDNCKGGGVYMTGGIVSNCMVQTNGLNSNGEGGGIYATGGQIISCRILDNFCGGNQGNSAGGGGIHAASPSVLIRNCLVARNSAINKGRGGGVYGGTIENCTVVGNSAVGVGGGVYGSTVTNSVVRDNKTASGIPEAADYSSKTGK